MHGNGRQAWQAWVILGMAAWVTVMMGAQCGSPPIVNTGAAGQLVFQGLSPALLSISGTSATDVYAVGADPKDGAGPYVLHYDGQNWKRLNTGATGELWWISVTPIDGAFYMAGSGGKVLQYVPTTGVFQRFTTPGTSIAFGVWGASASDLWAVGGDLNNADTSGFVWHYDGNQWSVVSLSSLLPQGVPILYKVWGRSPSDVYVVGRLGTVLHYDGTSWSKVDTDTTLTMFTVNGNASEVIAVGGLGGAVIEELVGSSFVNRAPAGTPQLNGVFVPGTGDAVAVGNSGTVARRTAAGWQVQPTGFSTTRDFHGTWVDPEGGIWAVGGNLTSALNQGMLAYIGSRTISSNVSP